MENIGNETPTDTSSDLKELLAKLAEQQRLIDDQRKALERQETELKRVKIEPRSGDSKGNRSPSCEQSHSSFISDVLGHPEFGLSSGLQDQKSVNITQKKLSITNDEILQNKMTRITVDQALSHSGDNNSLDEEVSEQTLASLQNMFAQSTRPVNLRTDAWTGNYDDSTSLVDFREQSTSAGPYNRHRIGIWGPSKTAGQVSLTGPHELQFSGAMQRGPLLEPAELYGAGNRVWNSQGHRSFASQSLPGPPIGADTRYFGRRASYNPQAPAFVQVPTGMERLSPSAPFSPSPVGTPLVQAPSADFVSPTGGNSSIWTSGIHVGFRSLPISYEFSPI